MRSIAALFIALAGALAAPAMAQDIPGRVGRVAFIEGTAAVYTDPDQGWERAYVNSPLTSENSIWTDPGARAEVRVSGTAVRLDQNTQLDVARLDDEAFEAFVPRGTVAVRVRHYQRGRDLVFDTPHARFSLRADGRYRIDVDPDLEESRITVFAGDASVGSDSGPVRAKAGQTVRVFGGASSSYVVERAFSDPFDTWASQRDTRWVETRSVQYVSPDMTGYEDLDSYGNWSQDPNYGAVWYPTRVASDWAPYRYGRWDYVRPWGWTWIDDSPWGYAPFHYGRWVSVNNRWAWYPGKREARPVWAPALVAWIGGANFSVGVSSGSPSVGWYPLSPYDRYQPWYNASPTYITQVNVVVNNYPQRQQNAQARDYNRSHGATVVNRETVVDRRPVQQARVNVRPEALAAAAVVTAGAVLPARNEVVQRRVAQRTQEPAKQPAGPAPRAGQATVAGANNTPAARPDFKARPPVAAATPQPAKAAPAPVRRVTAPSATPVARPERAAQPPTTREAQTPAAREAQPATREPQRPAAREAQPTTREAQTPAAREPQTPAAREAQPTAREPQRPAAREAQPTPDPQKQAREAQQAREQQTREAQQKQQQERATAQQQQQQAREQQTREAQQKQQQTREAQQKQQQERATAQQQQQAREQQTREVQQKQQQERAAAQQQQQAREQQSREAQQKQQQERAAAQQQQQQAREAQQKQQQQQQQQAREAQQKQQQQQPAERAQRTPPPPPPARTREEQSAKDKKDKDDEEKKKSGR